MNLQKKLLTIFSICCCIPAYAQDKPIAGNPSNIISVMPFQFTENGLGFGGCYERTMDKKGFIAFYVPAMVTFDVANSNRIYDYNTGNYNTGKADAMFYTMPGVKWYPAGSHGKIKYAAGLSVVIGSGHASNDLTNLNGLNVTEQIQSHFIVGGMLQNSLNVNTGKNLYAGMELGVGSSFINKVGKVQKDNEFLIQGAFKIGYRF